MWDRDACRPRGSGRDSWDSCGWLRGGRALNLRSRACPLTGKGWRLSELASAKQHHAELVAQVVPSGIARRPLGHEDGNNVGVSKPLEAMAVAQYLAEAEPELSFFVLVGDALDLGDEHRSVVLPGKVEVGLLGQPGARFDSGGPQGLSELVLCVCVALEAALDKCGIDEKRFSVPRQGGDLGFAVRGAQRRCRRSGRLEHRWWRRRGCGGGELREDVDQLRRELVQVGLHRSELVSAPEEEGEVEASGVRGSQLVEDGPNIVGALAQLGEGQWLVEWEGAVQIEPPAGLGARDLQPAACFAPVGEPDGRSLGDATGGPRPGDDRALVQAVVKDDVAGLDPPDQ